VRRRGRLSRALLERPAGGDTRAGADRRSPDAPIGTFTHWLAWNIDPLAGGLAEGESAPAEGRNDFGIGGWSGPCPPPGHGTHRYFFRLHALDAKLDLGVAAGRRELDEALADHVVAIAELMATYER
jgi:Raf kinase inhibitor-like YbhB/YbcL family protein